MQFGTVQNSGAAVRTALKPSSLFSADAVKMLQYKLCVRDIPAAAGDGVLPLEVRRYT